MKGLHCIAAQNTYQQYEPLNKTVALHEYLRKLGKGHLVPKAFQTEGDRPKKVRQTGEHGIRAEHPATEMQLGEETEATGSEEEEKGKRGRQKDKAARKVQETGSTTPGDVSRPQRHRP